MSSTLVSLIVSLLFIVILLAGFLVGMWRGLKRSTVNMVLSLVGVVVAFFVTPVVTNAIVGINITVDGETMPIQEIALYLFNQDPDFSLLIATNANLKTLVLNLPSAIINAVLFMLITIAIECVLYLVYKLLASLVFKYKTGQKKRRVWGGVVGFVKTLVIALIAFMPLSSLIGLLQSMTGEVAVAEEQVADADEGEAQTESLLASYLSPTVVDLINGANNSAWVQICGVGGMDDAMFDYYAKVEIEGENVLIREEVSNIYQTANAVYMTEQVITNGGSLKTLDYDALSKVVDSLVDGELFKLVLADTLGEILVNYEDYGFVSSLAGEYEEILQNISDGLVAEKTASGSYQNYFANDIKLLFDIFRTLGENGIIDDIVALEDQSANNIIALLTGEEHGTNFANCILKVFNMNLIRASAEPIAQSVVQELIADEQIDSGTSSWTSEDWTADAEKINQTLDCMGEILADADIFEVLEDFTLLLDSEANYNITGLLSNIGKLADSITDIKLFTNSEGKSVFAGYLEDLSLSLPIDVVYDNEGNEKTISSYQDMFEFVAPSLELIKSEGIYDIVKTGTIDLGGIADILAEEGNDELLGDILLPLYQIDLTKEMANSIFDLTSLTKFEDKKAELGYFSTFLTTLNSKTTTIESTKYTYLDLVLENKTSDLIDVMLPTEVTDIFQPVFYMQSSYGITIKNTIITQMMTMLEAMTGVDITAPTTYTFKKDATQDHTSEFLNVTQGLVAINKYADANGDIDIKSVDSTLLGTTLEAMKYNAYRTTLMAKTETGIFGGTGGAFEAVMTLFKTEYEKEIQGLQALGAMGDTTAQGYYDKLTNNKYSEIVYTEMIAYFNGLASQS